MDVKAILSQLTLEEKASLCSGADFWHLKGVERLGIPSVMVCDGPHGLRKQDDKADHLGINDSIKAVCYPAASALAASFDRALLNEVGEALGQACQAENVAVLLGPGANIKRSPLCGRNFEYFSEDPYLSSEMAAAHIQGVQSRNVGTSLKHYLANNQETRRMTGDSVIDERTLYEIYAASFEGAVKNGKPKTVMCAYNRINGEYASENKAMMTGLLRDKWGFEGLVVTDWGAGKDRVKGVEAGIDLEMPGVGGGSDAALVKAVQDGALDIAVLDQTVERVLNLINDYTTHKESGQVFDREKGHAHAGAVAQECAVLLKNERAVLPLQKHAKVAFIGEFAASPRFQGNGSSHINAQYITSALDAAKGNLNITCAQGYRAKDSSGDAALVEDAVLAAKNADIAVIFAGLPGTYESEGFDRKHMDMPPNQTELIEAIVKVQPNTVVVLHNGSPVTMPWIDKVPAVLEMYLGGDNVGAATLALLYGDANPSGKLAESFPLKLSDTPCSLWYPGNGNTAEYREGIYVGYRYYDKKEIDVLFPFGHGLSYTSFEYSGLKLGAEKIADTKPLSVAVTVRNAGKVFGKEVVQLYVRDLQSSIDRPVRELKGFSKVALAPGESKEVSFILDQRSFAYYETLIHAFHVESGEFAIEVGASSRDIRLSAIVTVESAQTLSRKFDRHSTIGDIQADEKGRAILAQMMAASRQDILEGATDGIGDTDGEMMRAMMRDMPISTLFGFGSFDAVQLEGLLDALNR